MAELQQVPVDEPMPVEITDGDVVHVEMSEAAEAALADVAEGLPEFAPAPLSEGPPRFTSLQLDLEVFQGPFDLLLELVMREEVDLLEVDLAEIVLAYVGLLEAKGELELEPVTEFVVLVAALMELKSRLMLPADESDEGLEFELGTEEAAEELLARLLQYHRYNKFAGWLRERFLRESRIRYRSAPPPARLRRISYDNVGKVYEASDLGSALGALFKEPEPIKTPHLAVQRVTLEQRLQVVRGLLERARSFDFERAVHGADRITECLTVFALLELYKEGEATWDQEATFGPIQVRAVGAQAA